MHKLHSVQIHPTDSCFSYALKRVGVYEEVVKKKLPVGLLDFLDVPVETQDVLLLLPYSRHKKGILRGDILVWTDLESSHMHPSEIRENGMVVWHKLYEKIHAAVYEGDDLISNLTTTTDSAYLGLQVTPYPFSEDASDPTTILRCRSDNL